MSSVTGHVVGQLEGCPGVMPVRVSVPAPGCLWAQLGGELPVQGPPQWDVPFAPPPPQLPLLPTLLNTALNRVFKETALFSSTSFSLCFPVPGQSTAGGGAEKCPGDKPHTAASAAAFLPQCPVEFTHSCWMTYFPEHPEFPPAKGWPALPRASVPSQAFRTWDHQAE